jgi:hypothetical protein
LRRTSENNLKAYLYQHVKPTNERGCISKPVTVLRFSPQEFRSANANAVEEFRKRCIAVTLIHLIYCCLGKKNITTIREEGFFIQKISARLLGHFEILGFYL